MPEDTIPTNPPSPWIESSATMIGPAGAVADIRFHMAHPRLIRTSWAFLSLPNGRTATYVRFYCERRRPLEPWAQALLLEAVNS